MRYLVFFLLICSALPDTAMAAKSAKKPEVTPPIEAQLAPMDRFIYYSLDGTAGSVSFPAAPGQRTLLHLWATWCVPCLRELPTLNALAKEKRKNLRIIAVALDSETAPVSAYFRRNQIDALTPYVDKALNGVRFLNITALPTTMMFDENGLEVDRFIGDYDWRTLNPDTWKAARMAKEVK
ncbi:MAG: TlpA family protein disulfide reductase [Bdellovibrionales bacterium]